MTELIKGKIVAIGGGEMGRPGYPVETTKIDKEIIRLTGKKRPRILFIPTASGDSISYYEIFKKHFGKRLKCKIDVLYLLDNKLNQTAIAKKIFGADAIYVGGGNTLRMMNAWRKKGVDKLLKKALASDIVLSGVSAGSLCWFKWGNSDSRKSKTNPHNFIVVHGLGLIPLAHCPHFDKEKERESSLKKMIKIKKDACIALDNCCALEIVGDMYRVISSKNRANAHKIYQKDGRYNKEPIQKNSQFDYLSKLSKF
jgi:dipeptidase E